MWDAWDVDAFYRNVVTDLTGADEVVLGAVSGETATVRVTWTFGASRVVQTLTLARGQRRLDLGTEVDWHETEKFLKAAFPLDLHAERYAAETQFGHVHRPTHTNSSWEAAKFEACAHRFVHLEEPGWGVSEAHGGRAVTTLTTAFEPAGAVTTDLLERPTEDGPAIEREGHTLRMRLRPFQIVTVRLTRAGGR
ncbi:hypothetical protein Srufu_005730 [Streptomyces libani subsp. rufus]|nr:hypothetical protein Srufu_005730 [Streptomyces libani subsp. rufus]